MKRTSPIPTAPSRRGFLAVLSAGAAATVAPAALAATLAHLNSQVQSAPCNRGACFVIESHRGCLKDRYHPRRRTAVVPPGDFETAIARDDWAAMN
jgi:hypothetical protein